MKNLVQWTASIALCVAVSACQSNSGSDESSPPATPPPSGPPPTQSTDQTPVTKPIPAPTNRGTDAAKVSAVLHPSDEVTTLFSAYLSDMSPREVPLLADQLTSEIFADDSLMQAKVFELQNSVAKLAQAKIYTDESENRVALLQADMIRKMREDSRADVLNHTFLIVGSAVAIGALAGTPIYENIPGIFPAAGRLVARGVRSTLRVSRDTLAGAYAGTRAGLSRLAAKESWQGAGRAVSDTTKGVVAGTKNVAVRATGSIADAAGRVRMSAEEVALGNLQDLELTEDQMLVFRDLDRVGREQVAGHPLLDTDIAGFKYAIVDQWNGAELGESRRVVLQVTRLVPNAGIPSYMVTPEISQETASAIAAKLAASPVDSQASRLGRFVYLFDRDSGVISRVRSSFSKFNESLHESGRRMLPLFSNVNWSRSIGTAAVSGAAMGIWYYTAFDEGQESGERYANLDLERMVPVATANLPPQHKPSFFERIRTNTGL